MKTTIGSLGRSTNSISATPGPMPLTLQAKASARRSWPAPYRWSRLATVVQAMKVSHARRWIASESTPRWVLALRRKALIIERDGSGVKEKDGSSGGESGAVCGGTALRGTGLARSRAEAINEGADLGHCPRVEVEELHSHSDNNVRVFLIAGYPRDAPADRQGLGCIGQGEAESNHRIWREGALGRDEYPPLAHVETHPKVRPPLMRVIDAKADLGPSVDPSLRMRYPLANQGWIDRLFEGHSVRESAPQHSGERLADRDDVAAEGVAPRDLDRHSRFDRQGLAGEKLQPPRNSTTGGPRGGLWPGPGFQKPAPHKQITGETKVAAVVADERCSCLGRHILPPWGP